MMQPDCSETPKRVAIYARGYEPGLIQIASRERLTKNAKANELLYEQLIGLGIALEIVNDTQSEQQ